LKHVFIVEERVLDGKKTKVVRGLKQEWMGWDYDCLETGGIVKCKLEDLPGDIVGQNDPEWWWQPSVLDSDVKFVTAIVDRSDRKGRQRKKNVRLVVLHGKSLCDENIPFGGKLSYPTGILQMAVNLTY
jgi:hypothetical protein